VRTAIDDGPFLPENALKAGLVDDLAYEDQVDESCAPAARATASKATTTRASALRRSG
jgi:hypothetical protein